MKDMIEENKEMAEGCPQRAVIDISKADLEAGKYDHFVEALNAALRHLEVTDLKAFISKQDMPGRWKFELHRAVEGVPADVSDSEEGIQELQGTLDEEAPLSEAVELPGAEESSDEIFLADEDGLYDPEA